MAETLNISDFRPALGNFKPVSLGELDGARLMSRFDSKYWFPVSQLPGILGNIPGDYYILEIENSRSQQYRTIYYDTPGDNLYICHHNGKLNRIKIRKREYSNSGIVFLELKLKNNKGKTNKLRIPSLTMDQELTIREQNFIEENTGLCVDSLKVKLINSFKRITLVHKQFTERCTIDFDLSFRYNGSRTDFSDMAIVELKQGRLNMPSELGLALKKNQIYKCGFSKYCIGRALLQPEIKKNQFKPKLLRIEKEFNHESYV